MSISDSQEECPGCEECEGKKPTLDYNAFTGALGELHRLIAINPKSDSGYSYCAEDSPVEYASYKGKPMFFDAAGNYRLGEDCTIVFPMIYVRTSVLHTATMEKTSMAFIH